MTLAQALIVHHVHIVNPANHSADLVQNLAILVLARSVLHPGTFTAILLFIAIVFGTINVIGGFFVTDRMLAMFKRKEPPKLEEGGAQLQEGGEK